MRSKLICKIGGGLNLGFLIHHIVYLCCSCIGQVLYVEGSLGGPKIDAFGKRTLSRIRIPKCIIDVAKCVVCFCLLVIDTCLQQLCFTHPRRSYLQSFNTNLYRFKLGGERIDTIMYGLMYVCRSVCGKPWPFLALVMIYYVGLYAITLAFSLMQFGP